MAMDRKTTSHDDIRRWVEDNGGVPAAVKNTLAGDAAGVLYIDFPGADTKDVDEITWEEFFKIFDRQSLALAYEESTPSDRAHPAWQLVDRDTGEPVTS